MDQFDDNIDRLASAGFSRRRSSAACLPLFTPLPPSRCSLGEVTQYRVLVLGPSKVGKTAIISQFLYDQFQPGYKPTVEEMYKVDLEVGSVKLSLNIEDTSGTFAYDFPSIAKVSLSSADDVLLVFSVDDEDSFHNVGMLRDLVMECMGPDIPMLVVGNKIDLDRIVDEKETEGLVECDWENGYVECSAKLNVNIEGVFGELINQAKNRIGVSPLCKYQTSYLVMTRRQSLPLVPVFGSGVEVEQRQKKKAGGRRGSIAVSVKKETCKVS